MKVMRLGQKVSLEHTMKTTANSQLSCMFCSCVGGNNSVPAGGSSLRLSFRNGNWKGYDCGHTGQHLGQKALNDGPILANDQLVCQGFKPPLCHQTVFPQWCVRSELLMTFAGRLNICWHIICRTNPTALILLDTLST